MSQQDEMDRDIDMVKRHVAQLSEHFEAVQVFVTRSSEEGTVNCHLGAGNWFARYGQVKLWTAKEEREFQRSDASDQGGD